MHKDKVAEEENYLAEKALEGKRLKKIGMFGKYKFEEASPKRLRYMIVFLDIKDLTKKAAPAIEENNRFLEFCKSKGWEYVCRYGSKLVFCTEDMEIPYVEKEVYSNYEEFCKLSRKGRFVYPIFTIIMMLTTIMIFLIDCNIWQLSLSDIVTFFASILAVIGAISNIVSYFVWKKDVKRSMENNDLLLPEDEVTGISTINILIAITTGFVVVMYTFIMMW